MPTTKTKQTSLPCRIHDKHSLNCPLIQHIKLIGCLGTEINSRCPQLKQSLGYLQLRIKNNESSPAAMSLQEPQEAKLSDASGRKG